MTEKLNWKAEAIKVREANKVATVYVDDKIGCLKIIESVNGCYTMKTYYLSPDGKKFKDEYSLINYINNSSFNFS